MNNKMAKGYIFAIVSAIIYGLMPLMSKYIYADGVNPITLVFLRNLLALPSLLVLVLFKHRTLKIRVKELPKISVLSFFGCCITPILLFSSYNYMATGAATVFHFVYPSLVALAGLIFFRRKLPAGVIISVIMCFVGVCLFYNPSEALSLKGSVLALLSAVTFASYVIILSNTVLESAKGLLLSFYVALISSVITLIMCAVSGTLSLPNTFNGWILCAVFAFMVTTLAVVFFQQSAFMIGGEKTSILSALEPATGVIVGAVVFKEHITPLVAVGSVLVVGASILIAVSDMKKSKENKIG